MEINEELFKSVNENSKNDINTYLAKGEKILWQEKPNVGSFIASQVLSLTPMALVFFLFDTFMISMIFRSGKLPFPIILFLIVFFAFHLTPVWMWIGSFRKAYRQIKTKEYYITSKRIVVLDSVNIAEIQEMKIDSLTDVTFSNGGIDKFLNVGDITLLSEDNKIVLYDIKNPSVIYATFQKIKNKYDNLSFIPNSNICEYCGTKHDEKAKKCSSCGASIVNNNSEDI